MTNLRKAPKSFGIFFSFSFSRSPFGCETNLVHCHRMCKSISKGFANKLCITLFAKKSRKYPSNGFANKVCNLVNFANRG